MKSKQKVNNRHLSVILFFSMLLCIISCSLISSFDAENDEDKINNSSKPKNELAINSLSLAKTTMSLKVGTLDYIAVNVRPQTVQKDVSLTWTYDKSIIECDTSSNWGVTVKGIKEGQTYLRCSCQGYDATCVITVTGYESSYETTTEPYIYSNTTILQTSPGITEKVYVSLYGGDVSDIDGYTWTIDNVSVASIQPTGQYCLITAKESGYARIKVTHKKAAYPYYIGVYVFADATNVSYITTGNNILTMNQDDSEQTVSVSLVNGKETSLDSNFSWKIVNEDDSEVPIQIQYNGNKAVIKPIRSGSCAVRITHPDASYPLDILCRVITIVKNVYIQPDNTIVRLYDSDQQIITSSLQNIDKADFDIDDFDYKLDDYDVAEIVSYVGNQVVVKGKSNGSTKLIISHPRAAYSREVLLIVTGQVTNNIVDASAYITTSQNYIRTKVGAEAILLNVSLKGGVEGDENGFTWTVSQQPDDGVNDVINLETPHGSAFSSRSVSATYTFGNAYITPKAEGTAVITIKHPKVVYPTEVLVKVLSSDSLLDAPLYFTGDGILKILNGQSKEYTVQLRGTSKSLSDDSSIKWSVDDSRLSVIGNGNIATVNAPAYGTGCTISHITAKHKKADSDKTVLVMTADDEETLNNMKALYADKLYYNFNVDDEIFVTCNHVGFDTESKTTNEAGEEITTYTKFDFSQFKWTVADPSIINVTVNNTSYPLNCVVKGLKSGKTKLIGSISVDGTEYSCEFTMTVYPRGTVKAEPEVYLTTTQNVINLKEKKSSNVSVSAINLPSSEYSNIAWVSGNEGVAKIISNGTSATIVAVSEGETVIKVSHPDSQNTLKIYVRVGSEFVDGSKASTSGAYIKSDDVVTLIVGAEDKKISAAIMNWNAQSNSGFTFKSNNESVAKISSQSKNGVAFISAVSKGYTEIEISHAASKLNKSVLVVVGYTQQEIDNILNEKVYFTTTDNTINFDNVNMSTTIDIKPYNLKTSEYSKISWNSADESVARVFSNGTKATVYSLKKGKTTITASYPGSLNSITFYVFVNAEDVLAEKSGVVYISAPDVISILQDDSSQKIQATLVNYTGVDSSGFAFKSKNESIAKVSSQTKNGIAYISPVNKGYTEIEITHPACKVSKSVLVVVGYTIQEIDSILNENVYLTSTKNTVTFDRVNKLSVVNIKANNLDSSKYYKIDWKSADESVAKVMGNGISASIYSVKKGKTTITASYPGSLNSITFYVFVDTEDIIPVNDDNNSSSGDSGTGSGSGNGGGNAGGSGSNITVPEKESVVYISATDVLSLQTGDSAQQLKAKLVNFTGADSSGFSFKSKNESIAKVESQSKNGVAYISPVSKGYTEIEISHTASKVSKTVLVVVGNTIQESNNTLREKIYLTTSNNTVAFDKVNKSTVVSVKTHNLEEYNYSKITWKSADESIAKVMPNGSSASIYSLKKGKTTITASCPGSLNSITFYVFVDTEDVIPVNDDNNSSSGDSGTGSGSGNGGGNAGGSGSNITVPEKEGVVYISAPDVLSLQTGGFAQQLKAKLVNFTGADSSGFSFKSKNESIARVESQSKNGVAYISPVSKGYTEVEITHTASKVSKSVLVVVGYTQQEIEVILNEKVYLTTSNNTIVFDSVGKSTVVSVKAHNLSFSDNYKINWKSADESIARVISNGTSATVYSVKKGKTTITATYPGSLNSITFYVFVDTEDIIPVTDNNNSSGSGSGNNGSGSGSDSNITVPEKEGVVYISAPDVLSLQTGASAQQLKAKLVNFTVADTSGFSFKCKNESVAKIDSQSKNGVAYIAAVSKGYAEVEITHTASKVSKSVLVVVSSSIQESNATLKEKIYLSTSNNTVFFDRVNKSTVVNIKPHNLEEYYYSKISWKSADESIAKVMANGTSATIYSQKKGKTSITATYPGSLNSITFYVFVDTEDIIPVTDNNNSSGSGSGNNGSGSGSGGNNGSGNGSDSNITVPEKEGVVYISAPDVFSLQLGESAQQLKAKLVNFTGADTSGFSFKCKNESVAKISSQSTNGVAYISAVTKGYTEIDITHTAAKVSKSVLVFVGYTQQEIDAILKESVYFTTSNNTIIFDRANKSTVVTVNAHNLSSSDAYKINWKSTDESIARVMANGTSASVYSIKKGKTSITVSYPGSLNSITFYVFVNTKDIIPVDDDNNSSGSGSGININDPNNGSGGGTGSSVTVPEKEGVVYISAPDVLSLQTGTSAQQLKAKLVNFTGADTSGFSFKCKNESVAKISSQSKNGVAYIAAVSKGYTEVEITHTASKVSKSVLVVVGATTQENNSTLKEKVYLTTSNNTIAFDRINKSTVVSVKTHNLNEYNYSNVSWKSADESIARVVANGTSATVYSVKKGKTTITASYPGSLNSITFYVFVDTEDIIPAVESVVYIAAPDVISMLKDEETQKLQATLVNFTGVDSDGFDFTIDNSSVAKIYAKSSNGVAYIKPVGSGQAEITITHKKSEISKKVLVVVGNSSEELAGFTYMTTSNNVVAIGEGNTKSVSVSVKNSESIIVDGYTWTSSNPSICDVISSGTSAVLKGNKTGTAIITVTNKACKYSLKIIAQVIDPIAAAANPYIQLTSSVMTLTCGNTYTSISAELVGGTDSDKSGFIWSSNDSKIAVVYGQNEVGKVKAVSAGTTYITVSHPKANYSAQILVVCDEEKKTDCYINVPSSIITMKPTDASQIITATLINGSTLDKYNFSWSLDVYDIIDLQYSANVCTITPKQVGTATITVKHPKAAYSQQIIVNVQQYSTFAFPSESMTVTQGDVRFISMQVPSSNVTTHIEYSVENARICSVKGTKSTAQITAVGAGTTTVTAKLVASSTGVVQSKAEMMLYVQEKPVNAVYITSANTITTVNKGKSQSLYASLTGTGVIASDQYELSWTTSDSDIVQVAGIGSDGTVKGQSIYITALKAGEAVITCSHKKAASTLQFYVVVPGKGEKVITLDKSYITIMKGSSGSPLKANIENKESSADYNKIQWACVGSNGNEVCRIMGEGQNVTIYPINVGTATVTAQLTDNGSIARCNVVVEAGKKLTFESTKKTIAPKRTVTCKYTVSPPDAILNWSMAQDKDYFTFADNGCDENGFGTVDIIGNDEGLTGKGVLTCVTDGGAKATITVEVAFDYKLKLNGSTSFTITPDETKTFNYTVEPTDALITIDNSESGEYFDYDIVETDKGTGRIIIKPVKETPKDGIKIKILGKDPAFKNVTFEEKEITAKFKYKNHLTPKVEFVNANGKWSRISNVDDENIFVIGDGENMYFKVTFLEKNADFEFDKIVFSSIVGDIPIEKNLIKGSSEDKTQMFTLVHTQDVIEKVYEIKKLFVPANKNLNWKNGSWYLQTENRPETWGRKGYQDIDKLFFQLTGPGDWYQFLWYEGKDGKQQAPENRDKVEHWVIDLVEDTSMRGVQMSEREFKNYAWLYCPGTPEASFNGTYRTNYKITYDDIVEGNFGTYKNGYYGSALGDDPLLLYVEPYIWKEHVQFDKDINSRDTSLRSGSSEVGYLTLVYKHNGEEVKECIGKVFLELRNCPKDYRP
ncbi:MAG: Ig-like domain-containing protein [Treponema sp.]|nr:Ig-like domain-containing protein [Treponema sp.]